MRATAARLGGGFRLGFGFAIIGRELLCYFVDDIDAGAGKFRAEALFRSRPDHVAKLVHKAHRGHGFVFSFLDLLALALADGLSVASGGLSRARLDPLVLLPARRMAAGIKSWERSR